MKHMTWLFFPHPHPRANSGFTLIEILVAMAIFSLIGLASAGVVSSVIDSNEQSKQRVEQLEVLQRAMLIMERDILQALPRPTRVNGELTETVMALGDGTLSSEADGMGFIRGGWHNPQLILPRSKLQSVGYRLQDNQLVRLYSNFVDNVIGFEPKTKILLTDIEDFQVSALIQNENIDEPEAWQDEYASGTLPLAISITLQSATFGTIRREFLVANAQ